MNLMIFCIGPKYKLQKTRKILRLTSFKNNSTYRTPDGKMSLEILYLDSQLNFLHKTCGNVFDDHKKRFHEDLFVIENGHKGKCWVISVFENYC